ncbi:MAG: DUF5126 domain-containing protein [Proteiniphilum sp.]
MKKQLIIIQIVILFLSLCNCTEVKDWQDPINNVPPGPVSDVKVESLHGGARITYTLPDDNDLLGVKAVYALGKQNQELREAFSSAFRDTIVLEGYADTSEYPVALYAIDKSRNESEPVHVTIKPLVPPVALVRESLKVNATFSGLHVTWENPMNKAIALSLHKKNDQDEMEVFDTYYSEATQGRVTFRGLESVSQDFKIELRDRWNNYAVPLDTVITPLYEQEILGKDPVTGVVVWTQWGWPGNQPDGSHLYRGDMHRLISGRYINAAVDGIEMSGSAYWHCSNNVLSDFVPGESASNLFPYYFTIDMGKKASYSRFRWWMRDRAPLYSAELPLDFEVYGTNDPKPLAQIGDGSKADNLKYWTGWPAVGGTDAWKEDWVKLADCHMRLPSGATSPATLTNEDQVFVRAGIEFEIDADKTSMPFRYIRFCVYSTNTNVPQFMISELKFWGAYAD